MSVFVPKYLPAIESLKNEGIAIDYYDLIPKGVEIFNLAILNLMPLKHDCEVDFLRLLSSSSLNIKVDFIALDTHESKNTPKSHIDSFYRRFSQIIENKYNGLIVTGAPVEKIDFEEVDYWDELKMIFDWSRKNVNSTLYVCWAAFAGLYYHYGITKYLTDNKISGVFLHKSKLSKHLLLRGFDDEYYVPHSRFAYLNSQDILKNDFLSILSESEDSGVYIVGSNIHNEFFVTGHSEYSDMTLDYEYHRDLKKGKNPHIPVNYYPNDSVSKRPVVKWRSHANLLINNWMNNFCK